MADPETNIESKRPARRHDLDALRAVAILLGILLHATLSFMPVPWPVQDTHQHEGFGLLFSALHGFRMPVFFLLSGFFTAMLWRTRGLKPLLWHRFRRIFLPLVLGTLTIVPAVNWISARAVESGLEQLAASDLWAAVRTGDVRLLDEESNLEQLDPVLGQTPLAMAALFGHTEIVDLLIRSGANVNAPTRDGNTPLHNAAFFGHAEAAELLLSSGADRDARNNLGQTVIEVMLTDWDMTQFIAAFVQVQLDRDRVIRGRLSIARRLQGPPQAVMSLKRMFEGSDSTEEEDAGSPGKVLRMLQLIPFFHHLWFLWFLCWLMLGFAPCAAAADRWNLIGPPRWLVVSPVRFLWLIPLTMIPQWFMGRIVSVFGPDTSAGLVPMPHVLAYYAIFFGFGVLYYGAEDDAGRAGRWWWLSIPIALLIVFPLGMVFTFAEAPPLDWMSPEAIRLTVGLIQVSYTWLMVFGSMGLFRRLLTSDRRSMCYVSDSSYWLYLAHVPLIIAAQLYVRAWDLPASVKFMLICVASTAVLLLSYQWCVRYTPIGTLLNGRRVRPKRAAEGEAA